LGYLSSAAHIYTPPPLQEKKAGKYIFMQWWWCIELCAQAAHIYTPPPRQETQFRQILFYAVVVVYRILAPISVPKYFKGRAGAGK